MQQIDQNIAYCKYTEINVNVEGKLTAERYVVWERVIQLGISFATEAQFDSCLSPCIHTSTNLA